MAFDIQSETYQQRFSGIIRLYGKEAAQCLANSHVMIVGIGGVGCWVAEAIARTGVGKITLMDLDEVCINNVNRQLHALDGEVGKPKVEVMKERILKISPDCEVDARQQFFTKKNQREVLTSDRFDVVIDAIDSVEAKCGLIAGCRRNKIPIIVCGGAGGRIDPTQIQVADLSRSFNDPLLAVVRKKLRREYNFPENPKRRFRMDCIFSPEDTRFPQMDGTVCKTHGEDEEGPLRLDCQFGYGTTTYITGVFGFLAAQRAVRKILMKQCLHD
ncbi:MAG: tRNA cyclic N6-threonylcarbamoyladenosine(37) synthase TcdA [Lentisphaeria bacterium]|nr:tRNA cyclic N6-threonylcarbamoyladenosine(37) synthase TcdA [Lentisphaeria bacterium]